MSEHLTPPQDPWYPVTEQQAPPASPAPPSRRGPTWPGVLALVVAGGVLSSGATLGAVVGYDQLTSHQGAGASASAPAAAGETGSAAVPVATRTDGSPDWEAVARSVSASTVAIQAQTAQGTAEGTGVIHGSDGTIITNNHVVSGARRLTVSLSDGRSFSADVVGTDPSTDLAVIRLADPPADLVPATFGDSSAVQVGEGVMAVGTPLGLDNTVTTGIVSAVHRPVTTQGTSQDGSDDAYTSAIQTDAAINPGNSGGPLVDAEGRVIGINSSIAGFANSSEEAGSIGLGFAIPSATVTLIADQLIQDGTARHALLGVTAGDGSQEHDGATYRGAQLRSISSGSPAQAAGLREGDLVIGIDDVPTTGAAALTAYVRSLPVSSTHTVRVLRDGQELTLEVTLTSTD